MKNIYFPISQGKTHILVGISAGTLYLHYVGSVDEDVLFFGGLIFGAMVPDIDHTGSKIGRAVPIIDDMISSVFGHRTFTHSLLFLILGYWLFHIFSLPESLEFGIMLGIISHIVLDMLTVDGVKFLWPLKTRVGIPFSVKTGGLFEHSFFLLLILLIGYTGYQIYL
ncbi:metal-dependent hydrolase [Caldifermentibacillus hisashii]|uniref:metal-dependent hydrolase n=2 Tax=Caldifermentibacillus hisashii TaxID=996558 RepID=UPI0031B6FD17